VIRAWVVVALAAAAAAVAAAGGSAAAEPARRVLLRSTAVPLDARVPLRVDTRLSPVETVLPGGARVSGVHRVSVTLDPTGRPTQVVVRQRLTLTGTGDYSFVVPAPASRVARAPGSDAMPGLRSDGIVWQGFVSGRRVLAADAVLAPAAAAALPLVIDLSTTVAGRQVAVGGSVSGRLVVRLRIRNDTGIVATGFDAKASPARVAPLLDRIRAAAGRGAVVPDLYVAVDGAPRARRFALAAPFDVSGTIRLRGSLANVAVQGATATVTPDGAAIHFRAVLGEDDPVATVRLTADARSVEAPVIHVLATPVVVAPELAPPTGASWAAAAAADGASLPSGRELVARASRAMLRLARIHQFGEFLAVPAQGAASATYVFRSAGPDRATPVAGAADTGTGGMITVAAVLAAVLALAGSALVAWAHL
jgi:hypothetical protein